MLFPHTPLQPLGAVPDGHGHWPVFAVRGREENTPIMPIFPGSLPRSTKEIGG
jgi:hypothetical protein